MKVVLRLLLGGACLTLVPPASAAEQAYVVSYVETAPAQQENAAELFRRLAMLSLKETGSVRFEVLRRIGYSDQFVVLEVWEDLKAREAHAAAAHTQLFRDKLKPLLRAPYDERPHIPLSVGNASAGTRGAVYTVTHVDVVPKAKDEGAAAVRQLSEASRATAGNERFDALTQTSRPNHMTLVEVWKDPKAVSAHAAADRTRGFRDKLGPLSGALFDERFYRALEK